MEEEKEKHFEWMEHLNKAFDSFFKEIKELVPEETYDHLKNSRRESLLALRAIIDKKIEKLEKKEVHRVEVK